MVSDFVKDCGIEPDAAAKHLVTQAEDRGSQDNITVVIVFFEDGPLVTSCKSPSLEKGGIIRQLLSCVTTCTSCYNH